MSAGIGSLHKILKDETRQRIVPLLHEKGSSSYVDLMRDANITSTGKMNYHLKVLGSLITKTADGQYTLTDKGKVASQLLLEFPQEDRKALGMKPRWWRTFWIMQAVFVAVSVVINLELYFYGYIDQARLLYQSTISIIGTIGVTYMITHIMRDVMTAKGRSKFNRILYVAAGSLILGFLIWLAQGKIMQMTGVMARLDNTFGGDAYYLISLLVYYIIGGFIGSWIGKKRAYYLPQWPA
jgi:hypothetical protein